MTLLFLSFVGGVLTILSPCVLPLLPVIIGGSLTDKNRWRPVVITASLSASVVVFTLLLKWSTVFIEIPQSTWAAVSGVIIVVLGLVTLFPEIWEKVSLRFKFSSGSNKLLASSSQKKGLLGAALMGVALGPVFSSCSPTYALILATVLPQSFFVGFVYLIAYAVGLSLMLFLVALFGQRIVSRLKWAVDPHGLFKRILGALFIIVGLAIVFGIDKQIESYVVQNSEFNIAELEIFLLEDAESFYNE